MTYDTNGKYVGHTVGAISTTHSGHYGGAIQSGQQVKHQQEQMLAKRSPIEEALDVTACALDELSSRLNLLTEKLSPICLPMIAETNRTDGSDRAQAQASTLVNKMRANLLTIDRLNHEVNCIIGALEI